MLSPKAAKADLAEYVRKAYNIATFLKGIRTPKIKVALYGQGRRPGKSSSVQAYFLAENARKEVGAARQEIQIALKRLPSDPT